MSGTRSPAPGEADAEKVYAERPEVDPRKINLLEVDGKLIDAIVANKTDKIMMIGAKPQPEQLQMLCAVLAKNTTVAYINLARCGIATPHVEHLCHALEFNKTIVGLDLSCNSLADDDVRQVARALRINKHIEHLFLQLNRFGPVGMYHLCNAIVHVSAPLRSLDLSRNPIGDEGAMCLRRMCEDFCLDGRTCGIERLYLNKCGLASEASAQLCYILDHRLMPQLQVVHVTDNDFGEQDVYELRGAALRAGVKVKMLTGVGDIVKLDWVHEGLEVPPLSRQQRRLAETKLEPEVVRQALGETEEGGGEEERAPS
ncbi:unnamed protein product [Pedinophyceae sp. YPF-701]|nr:unnamed protein product [Pedinophyceae sp. YPF-701]